MDYDGPLFRALHPYHAREPLSGEGARRHGGRFNAPGQPALYLARDFDTLRHEIRQGGSFQPSVIVEFDAKIRGLFDSRNAAALAAFGLDAGELADPAWRLRMKRGRAVQTQELAQDVMRAGHCGMAVRSFARGARPDAMNIVLWSWGVGTDALLRVVDDEARLR